MREYPVSSTDTRELGWLLDSFADRTPDVSHAIAISTDGLLVAATRGLRADRADQLAATGSGLVSLLRGAARFFDAGAVISNVTQMDGGFMFSMAFSDGASLLVLAAPTCDVGQVSYEMTELANRIGDALTPAIRAAVAHGASPGR
jgi:predicted regulator of Ras-like GTPase activity (Roadblock/LC7/MglB family)